MTTPANQLDELIATTFQRVKPVISDNITKRTALLAALDSKSKLTQDGGLTLRRPLMFARNDTVKSYSGYDLIDTTPQAGFGFAEFPWRQLAGSITISGEEERKNAGVAQIISLLQAKFDQLRLSLEFTMNTMLWGDGTGNGGKDILGIKALVSAAALTVGGIAETDTTDPDTGATWWAPVRNTSIDLTTLDGVKTMNSVYNSLYINLSRPDFEFASQAVYEAYEALAAPNIRFQDLTLANLGFSTVAHKTAELVFESAVPSASLYFLNTDHLEFVQHDQAWMKMLDWVRPYNQDARVTLVISQGNLICDSRRAHAVASSIVTS